MYFFSWKMLLKPLESDYLTGHIQNIEDFVNVNYPDEGSCEYI